MSGYLLTTLTQFAGEVSPEEHFGRPGLAAFFWLTLIWLASHQRQYEAGIKKMLITGFTLGFMREVFMLILLILHVSGLISHETLHPYYPPFEHMLSSVSVVWIIAAYLSYLKNLRLVKVFLFVGLTVSCVVLAVTVPGWFVFRSTYPSAVFGQTWYGGLWHISGVVLIGAAMYMTVRIPGWPRVALFFALGCFFLDDALMLFSLVSHVPVTIYYPIRNLLHMAAIPMFGYIFMREQWERQELNYAELQHGKRELRSLAEVMEQRVVERTAELELSAMRLQQAEELAHFGHWSFMMDEGCFLASEEVFNIFELPYSKDGITLEQWTSFYPSDERISMIHLIDTLLEKGIAYDVTRQLCFPDGRIKYVYIKCFPGDAPDLDAVGTLQEVTVQVTLENAMQEREAELIAARHAAEAANRAKSAFLATMSHEIRTPLNAMIGNVTLLGTTSLNKDQVRYMRNCTTASQTLLRVINDILDFSKIEAGRMELVKENYSPGIMLDNLVNVFACRAEEKKLGLSLTDMGLLPDFICGDRQRLSQIISNLLSNAIKFTERGNIALSASTNVDNSGRMVLVVSVRDSGIGIPLEQQRVIFDSFTQLESFTTRRQSGTGLGLAICSRLVELMGGSIILSSKPGDGSTFTVSIPVIPGIAPIVKIKPQKGLTGVSRNILLADDDELGRMVVATLLERKGHRVTTVKNGAKLLTALQGNHFDILLTDISMPDMEGTEVARIIRSGERKDIDQLIPIIALTAHAFTQDRERFLDSGINGYISKPFNFEELLELIEDICDNGSVTPSCLPVDHLRHAEADAVPLNIEHNVNRRNACL